MIFKITIIYDETAFDIAKKYKYQPIVTYLSQNLNKK